MMKKYLLLTLILAMNMMANAAIRYVVPSGTSGDGTSWATAYAQGSGLIDAIEVAESGDEIWVATGTYYNPSQTTYFTLKTGVTVYGGFAGTETSLAYRNFNTNVITLSGDIDGISGLSAGDAYHVVSSISGAQSGTLDGFTITGGYAFGTIVNGGGIYAQSSTPTIKNCIISGNAAQTSGGGVYLQEVTGTGTLFDNCIISSNSGAAGGGIYNNSSIITLTNSSVSANFGTSQAAGMYIYGNATTYISNCVFNANISSPSIGANGGLVFGPGSSANQTVTIINTKFTNNNGNINNNGSAGSGGAILFTTNATNSVINANISNCLFTGNNSRNGGAICIGGATSTSNSTYNFVNCTIANNSASNQTGGLFIQFNSSIVKLDNCVIWGNTCSNTANIKQLNASGNSPTSIILTYTCISNQTKDISGTTINRTATSNKYTDPLFVNSTNDFRLQSTSPCKNTGDNLLIPSITTDVRGAGYARRSGTIDMGAYEYINTWTGGTDNVWATGGNWADGTPASNDPVIIPDVANNPLVTGAVSCSSLAIETGGVLTIAPTGTMDVTGSMKNSAGTGGLLIQSDVNGTGSLKHGTSAIQATVERYMTPNVWHQVSSPVVQTVASFLTDPDNSAVPTNTPYRGMMDFATATNTWNTFFTDAQAQSMTTAKGYMLRTDAPASLKFKGNLNAGNQSVSLVINGSNGWNNVGNPYPSAFDVSSFYAANSSLLDVSHSFIYIWDAATSAYTIHNNLTAPITVQSAQGFFVKPTAASTLNFTTAMQVHANTAALKSAATLVPEITLIAKNSNKQATTAIKFLEGASLGLDVGKDAGILKGDPNFALFTRLVEDNGVQFMMQVLPDDIQNSLAIPVGIDCKAGGELIISAQTINLPSSYKLILEDKVSKTLTDLSIGNYTTTIPANTIGADRFVLHTSALSTGSRDASIDNLSAYLSRNELFVNGLAGDQALISLFDLQGRLILQKKLSGSSSQVIGLPSMNKGFYMAVVKEKGLSKSFKLLVK